MVKNKQVKISDIIIPKYYNTFNDTHYMHKIFTSGRAGTKSSRMAIKAIYKIISDDDCSVIVLRKFHNKLRKTVFNEVNRAITRLGLDKSSFRITRSPMQVKYLKNGNSIYFTGNDSLDDTKGIIDDNGKPIKLVCLDELTEFFEKGDGEDELLNIEATFVRGNIDEFCMEYYFNPPKNPKSPIMQWVDKMEQRDDCIRVHSNYLDVPVEWLGSKLIDSANQLLKSDSKMYRWIWMGDSVGLDDVIYYMFDESKHVVSDVNYSDVAYLTIGIDYGQMNATTFQCFGIDLMNKYILGIDEYYHSGRDSGQKSPSEYAKEFKYFKEKLELETDKKVIYVYIDPSAKGLAEEIKRVCPDISIRDANNTVNLGIQRVSKLLALNRMKININQKHLIEEMYLYEYDEKSIERGQEQPNKENDHCQDATRYAIMGMWGTIKNLLPNLKYMEGESNE